MATFEELLQQLGTLLSTELYVDKDRSCLLTFPDGLELFLQQHTVADQLIVGTKLGTVPPGAARQSFFRLALIANGQPPPRFGNLAYSRQADQMVLFELLSLEELNGNLLAEYLESFIPRAHLWRQAIRSGRLPDFKKVAPKPSF